MCVFSQSSCVYLFSPKENSCFPHLLRSEITTHFNACQLIAPRSYLMDVPVWISLNSDYVCIGWGTPSTVSNLVTSPPLLLILFFNSNSEFLHIIKGSRGWEGLGRKRSRGGEKEEESGVGGEGGRCTEVRKLNRGV